MIACPYCRRRHTARDMGPVAVADCPLPPEVTVTITVDTSVLLAGFARARRAAERFADIDRRSA